MAKITKTQLLLMLAIQKGIRSNRESFIDLKQKYLEPTNPKRDRRLRYKRKRQYFEKKGLKDYEKL